MSKCNGVFVNQSFPGESVDSLLKKFKKKIKLSKILQLKTESDVFIKPSVKKRLKKIEQTRKNKNNLNLNF